MGFMGPNGARFGTFEETFRCYSMVFFENAKAEEEYGGKSECQERMIVYFIEYTIVILPSSALEKLGKQELMN